MLKKNNNSVEISFNQFDNTKTNIVFFGFNLPDEVVLPKKTIIFQSEDLAKTTSWIFDGERGQKYLRLLENYPFIDYSKSNLHLVENKNKTYLPFLYCDKLKSTFERNPLSYFLFYGSLTNYRKKVINNLNQFPIKSLDAGSYWNYGFYRNKLLLESAALLNIHKNETANKFESIRCFFSLINNVPFITESYALDPDDYYRDCIYTLDSFTNNSFNQIKDDLNNNLMNKKKFELFKSYNALKIFNESLNKIQL
tara:strand:- start:190 stop:948 length:759 start_codon:yes stop_codon:yes gene_type:complete